MNEEIRKGKARMGKGVLKRGCGLKTQDLSVNNFFNKVKVIKFKDVLEFKEAILLCYRRQKTITLQQKVFKVKIWSIPKALIGVLKIVLSLLV
jgi:hypothetical protein